MNQAPSIQSLEAALQLTKVTDWRELAGHASDIRQQHWGNQVTYSRKVFVPLTYLCRDVCHYCTFARTPNQVESPYLTPEQVLDIARQGQAQGCKEVLFTLGDQPETRYKAAREALVKLGATSTLDYLEKMARLVLEETGLLPHLNPGLMGFEDYRRLRSVAPSMGIMLESTALRLCQKGGPHYGSPDKDPALRLESLRASGRAKVPMTSGILIGIGETRAERIDALWQLRQLAEDYGHLQEIIVQNFKAKNGTKMAGCEEPSMEELLWTIACARLILPPEVSLQAPPNLFNGRLGQLIEAGINDWGGVSPVTPDHVNPEAPWPHLDKLRQATEDSNANLVERLTAYPRFIREPETWLAEPLRTPVLKLSDGAGLARVGQWSPGATLDANVDDLQDVLRPLPQKNSIALSTERPRSKRIQQHLKKLFEGGTLSESAIAELFTARGGDFDDLCHAADQLRRQLVGETVTYAVVRNINYTNICLHHCKFCAFSKGKGHDSLRGKPYLLDTEEIKTRVREASAMGATEVCMQGGIHPHFTGQTYLNICRAAKAAVPDIHVHAFSPLEIAHGAETLGISVKEFLQTLKAAGLGSLPGTAAEILHDPVRQQLAPGKMNSQGWINIIRQAHKLGLNTTATIMFGHIDSYLDWAKHLLLIKILQQETGGFTEFVPLPFVHMEAPMYRRGQARKGPTLRETLLMHAISRLVLAPEIKNIQVSWVKVGPTWASHALNCGVNDLGGTLINESISRAAGAAHGQEYNAQSMEALITQAGRIPQQRNTLYQPVQKPVKNCTQPRLIASDY